ncbi:MAG: VOC family protein [Desulfarculus sp.]|nr:VOC family protein [Desulfarculus sp.]
MKAQAIDHVCIAVKDLSQARRQYEDILGLELHGLYQAPSESIRVARYYLGAVALELMEPMNDDCEVARFLRAKGEGVFLISYQVENVQAGLDELRAKGYATIDQAPRKLMGNRYAFITPPKDTCGVLTEIVDGGFDGSYDNPTTE